MEKSVAYLTVRLLSCYFFHYSPGYYHIYLNRYREYGFASLDNCQMIFVEFQRLLWEIATVYKRHGGWIQEKLPDLKLFDLKNVSNNIDEVIQWKRKVALGDI